MARPILYNKEPFDPMASSQVFKFSYQGTQAHANRLIIEPYVVAEGMSSPILQGYDAVIETLKMEHTLPAGSLARNACYSARIMVKDRNGQWSAESDPVIFWCFGTPQFQFEVNGSIVPAVQESITVENSSVEVGLMYKQNGKEGLSSYRVDLYDASGQLMLKGMDKNLTGDLRYDTTDPRVTIRGLEDNRRYFIQAFGITDHGMRIQTNRLGLNVEYEAPPVFSLIEAVNMEEAAQIRIHSNLKKLEGHASIENPRYIDNQRIDLTGFGERVIFDEGFNLSGDFTIHLLGENYLPYQEILVMRNGQYEITLTYMRGFYDEHMQECGYFILRVYNGLCHYELTSNYFLYPWPHDSIYVWIQRKGNLYNLQCCVLEGDHNITDPREFDVNLGKGDDWQRVTYEGFANLEDGRLEF